MYKRIFSRLPTFSGAFSLGSGIICLIALVSSFVVIFRPNNSAPGMQFWVFARNHKKMYDPMTKNWNNSRASSDQQVNILLLSANALQRRLLAGFRSGTPLPDLVETLSGITAQTFKGPLDSVGFTDLTDVLSKTE